MVCYHTAYLKAHYPTEFMASLATTDMGNADKIVGYFTECRGLRDSRAAAGRESKPRISPSSIRAFVSGLAAIKNVGEGAVEAVIESRTEGGPFRSFFDLFRRVDLRKLNKRMMEGLIKAGAFDSMGGRRSQYLAVLDQAMDEG